jgi:hypothetical protein
MLREACQEAARGNDTIIKEFPILSAILLSQRRHPRRTVASLLQKSTVSFGPNHGAN